MTAKLLGADERVVMQTRTHGKALLLPALGMIGAGGFAGAGAAVIPAAYRPAGQIAIGILALALATWWAIIPFLRWRTTTYTLTNRRLITRQGIVGRNRSDLPLLHIGHVSYQRNLLDRMLGCGKLIIQTAAADRIIVLDDVPDVALMHATITELLFGRGGQA